MQIGGSEVNPQIVKLIRKHGMKPVKWNIDSSDWRHVQAGEEPGKSLEIILEALPHTHGTSSPLDDRALRC